MNIDEYRTRYGKETMRIYDLLFDGNLNNTMCSCVTSVGYGYSSPTRDLLMQNLRTMGISHSSSNASVTRGTLSGPESDGSILKKTFCKNNFKVHGVCKYSYFDNKATLTQRRRRFLLGVEAIIIRLGGAEHVLRTFQSNNVYVAKHYFNFNFDAMSIYISEQFPASVSIRYMEPPTSNICINLFDLIHKDEHGRPYRKCCILGIKGELDVHILGKLSKYIYDIATSDLTHGKDEFHRINPHIKRPD